MKYASRVLKPTVYVSAEDTMKPGYLAAKFAAIRAKQRKEAVVAAPKGATVSPLKRVAR